MLTQTIWWITNALEAIIIGRAAQQKFIKTYPMFYVYLTYVLVESILRYYIYVRHPAYYGPFYWSTQLLSVFLGYGVVWEIYRQALSRYPGALRISRNALALIFVVVVFRVLLSLLWGGVSSLPQTTAELERDFRAVKAFLLLSIAGVMLYYRIQIGRNLRGMMVGYGFFIGTSIIILTLRSHFGDQFQIWWQYLQPAVYVFVLLAWCVTLWSYQPNPEPDVEPRIEQDYQSLVQATRQRFRQIRAHVGRTVRP